MKKAILLMFQVACYIMPLMSQYNSKIDLFNNQMISYDFKEVVMEENACIDYGELYMRVPYFMNIKDTSVQSKLNQYYHTKMVLNLNSLEFRKLMSKHAINAEIAYDQNNEDKGNKQLMTCDFNQSLYVPNVTQVNAYIGSLINDVLTVGVTYVYSTTVKNSRRMTNLRYNVLEYFNVKTGKIYTTNDVFIANSLVNFNQIINNAYKNNQYIVKYQELYKSGYDDYDDMSPSVSKVEVIQEEKGDDIAYGAVEAPDYEEDVRQIEVEMNHEESDNDDYSEEFNVPTMERPFSTPFFMPNLTIGEYEYSTQKQTRELKEFNANLHGMYGFNGANFYYIMPAFQPCHHFNDGESLHFSFSLDELKKYINPSGPYGFLLKLNIESNSDILKTVNQINQNNNLLYQSWSNINQLELKPNDAVKKVNLYSMNQNYNQLMYYGNKTVLDTNRYVLKQTLTFNKGKLISKIEREIDTFQNKKWIYEYNEHGDIKSISHSQNNYIHSMHSFHYNLNRQLIKETLIENNQFSFEKHYLYLNKVLHVNHTYKNSENEFNAYYYKNTQQIDSIQIINDNYFTEKTLRYDSVGNHILTYDKFTKEFQYFLFEDRLIKTIGNGNEIIDFVYNLEGKLIEKMNQEGGFETMEYDKKGRLLRIKNNELNTGYNEITDSISSTNEFYSVIIEYID